MELHPLFPGRIGVKIFFLLGGEGGGENHRTWRKPLEQGPLINLLPLFIIDGNA